MEERSGSSGLPKKKKKSASGCLIIKKQGRDMEKKRPRLFFDDSDSSRELLEPLRRKIEKFGSTSSSYNKGFSESIRNGESGSEKKRSSLDMYDFDEYDEFDEIKMKNSYILGRSETQRECGSGSSKKDIVYKRRRPHVDNTTNLPSERNKEIDHHSSKGEHDEVDFDETHLPLSSLRGKFRKTSDEPIRLQGKNGVLKVMVNNKTDLSNKSSDSQKVEEKEGFVSRDITKKNSSVRPSFSPDTECLKQPVPFSRMEDSKLKRRKEYSDKLSISESSDTDDSDASLKQGKRPSTGQASCSTKQGRKGGKCSQPTRCDSPTECKEQKAKRGGGTEKQLLREQIKNMLIAAGWTIDYRPRRNRDYLDAVYINPSGTAYWSIIKAYDALQKQLENEDTDVEQGTNLVQFTSLSEETLSKLTRQTQKKMEREMKKKKRDDIAAKSEKKTAIREYEEGTDTDQSEEKLSLYKKQNGKSLKGQSHEAHHDNGNAVGKFYSRKHKRDGIKKFSASPSHAVLGRKSRKVGRCTLMVRSSDKDPNSETDSFVSYRGKRTILAWLIDSGTVQPSEKLQYMNRKRKKVMLEGWITRDGIHCSCCSKILPVSKFELHAGSKQRQPFQNIILESGISLLQCQMDAWKKQKESEHLGFHSIDVFGDDPNDDTCCICGDGGDLICCDGCPSTFHQSCLDIQMLPTGDWHCPNCTCKFCGILSGSVAEDNSGNNGLLKACAMCEKKYHESCGAEVDYSPSHAYNATVSFCGKKCQQLFDHLQKLVGIKHELEAGYSWSLLHRTDPDLDTAHNGFPQRVECNSKLAVALSIMDECFLPIIDRRSEVNLLHSVLYNCGSNFSRLNYSGFFTAILERGEEIISVASIRIRGTQLAEMPFIGTRNIYRRQGMCRRLLGAIELALWSLKIEKLIIPAIAEHTHTWTVAFGFHPVDDILKQEMKSMNMLAFPGIDMLHKQLMKIEKSEGNTKANTVVGADLKNSCPPSSDMHEVTTKDTDAEAPVVPSNNDALMSSSFETSKKSKPQISSKDSESQLVPVIAESSTELKCSSLNDEVRLERENIATDGLINDVQVAEGVLTRDADQVHIGTPSCLNASLESECRTSSKDIKAQSTSELPEFSSTLKVDPSVSGSSTLMLKVENVTSNALDKDEAQSTARVVVSDVDEVNCGNSGGNPECDSLGGVLIGDTSEVPNERQKRLSESTVQNINMNHESESSFQTTSAASGDMKGASTKVNTSMDFSEVDDYEVNTGVKPVSNADIYEGSKTKEVTETISSTPISVNNGTEAHTLEMNSVCNQSGAFYAESKANTSSEHFLEVEVASNAKVDPVEDYVQSSTVSAS